MNKKNKILITLFVLVCFATGFGLYLTVFNPGQPGTPRIKNTSMVGKTRPVFSMKDTSDTPHNIKEWDGKVIMLNFWATWCPPCRREIPAFINLYDKYHGKGLIIVGVALDSKQNAIDFVDPMGINYPIVVGEEDGIALTQAYGNDLGILPYTVIIDRKGVIRHTILHEVSQQEVEQLITPLL
jgi:peroxiredoxin